MKACVVGGGIGGLAVATLLARRGIEVTILERFETPHPVGAGVLVQPTGLQVLGHMGLLKELEPRSARIDRLLGDNHRGKRIMDVNYQRLDSGLYGLGVHRGALFEALLQAAIQAGANLRCAVEVTSINQGPDQVEVHSGNASLGRFDLLVIASGTQSHLRDQLPIRQWFRPFPWGAVWSMCPIESGRYQGALLQYYHRANGMMGILPTGTDPRSGRAAASFFWSIELSRLDEWQASDFSQWRETCYQQWPLLDGLLDHLGDQQSLHLARYGDVVMKQWHHQRIVCIGDAAHGMSPQLGQGVNLALIDAWILSLCLENEDVSDALAAYSRLRRRHLNFYQRCSRWLTPMFQSNSYLMPLIRDVGFRLARRIAWTDREAIRTVSGLKTGLLGDPSIDISGPGQST